MHTRDIKFNPVHVKNGKMYAVTNEQDLYSLDIALSIGNIHVIYCV